MRIDKSLTKTQREKKDFEKKKMKKSLEHSRKVQWYDVVIRCRSSNLMIIKLSKIIQKECVIIVDHCTISTASDWCWCIMTHKQKFPFWVWRLAQLSKKFTVKTENNWREQSSRKGCKEKSWEVSVSSSKNYYDRRKLAPQSS